MSFTPRVTRFRAYQLGSPGSSFSYFSNCEFRLIEGRLTNHSNAQVEAEMVACGVDRAASLDITSWDMDHCCASELPALLRLIRPLRIETPGYEPDTDNGRECREIIRRYKAAQNQAIVVQEISPAYIDSLETTSNLAFKTVIYHPRSIDSSCHNNNSTVKLYRTGSFNVLSLGDVEDPNIGSYLRRQKILKNETDVMILAHHGADNGFTTKKFLQRIDPRLAICTADYDNKHDHPRDEIRELLHEQEIRLMTTKTGDVLIRSIGNHTGNYEAINYIARSTEESSTVTFKAKKATLLAHNNDTLRQHYALQPPHRRFT